MVFIGGWRSRRRRGDYGPPNQGPAGPFGNQDPNYPPYGRGYGYRRGFGGYGRRGFGGGGFGGGGGSCMRDMFLVESGCCLAELLGCGPQLLLVAPRTLRRPAVISGAHRATAPRGLRQRLLVTILSMITRYQQEISPKRRACCRYTPTCSHYAAQALETYGLGRGLWLTARRLVRCHPRSVGGNDPVPSLR